MRAFDDCIVLKGLMGGGGRNSGVSFVDRPVRGILVERCVIWNDWGRALEIGAETSTPEIADVVFRDCDIIRTDYIAMDIQHGHRANVHDIRFENIRVEADDFNLRPVIQKTRDEKYVTDPKDDYRPYLCTSSSSRTPGRPTRITAWCETWSSRTLRSPVAFPPVAFPGTGCRA